MSNGSAPLRRRIPNFVLRLCGVELHVGFHADTTGTATLGLSFRANSAPEKFSASRNDHLAREDKASRSCSCDSLNCRAMAAGLKLALKAA